MVQFAPAAMLLGQLFFLPEWVGCRNLPNEENPDPAVRKFHAQCRTRREDGLIGKGQTSRRERHSWQNANAAERKLLRAAGGVVRYAYSGVPGAGSGWRESHADIATPVWRNGRGTVVGFGKVAAVGSGEANRRDGEGGVAGVG